jgi:hypothetical protein
LVGARSDFCIFAYIIVVLSAFPFLSYIIVFLSFPFLRLCPSFPFLIARKGKLGGEDEITVSSGVDIPERTVGVGRGNSVRITPCFQ